MKYSKLAIIFSYLQEHLDLCYQNSDVFLCSSLEIQCHRKVTFIKQEQGGDVKTLSLTITVLFFKFKKLIHTYLNKDVKVIPSYP